MSRDRLWGMFRSAAAGVVLSLAGCSSQSPDDGTGGTVAAADGSPDRNIVAALITGEYVPGASRSPMVRIDRIDIGDGRAATAGEDRQFQVAQGETIYPVHAVYALVSGDGRSRSVRDWDTHFFAFRSAQHDDGWDLTSAAVPGDRDGDLRLD